jgi:very-short-patch-repair endonuclease
MTVEKKIEDMIDGALLGLKEHALFSSSEEGLTPIEKLLRGAFMAREIHSSHWIDVKFWATIPGQMTIEKIQRFPHHNFRDWVLHVFQQVAVGPYRLDFLAFVSIKDGAFNEVARHYLAIECDGHEFHEKTKEQAARDKARDRFMTGLHIPVMHFTGSEIWREANDCVSEVLSYYERLVAPEAEVA